MVITEKFELVEWLVQLVVEKPPLIEDYAFHASWLSEYGIALADSGDIEYDIDVVTQELQDHMRFGVTAKPTMLMCATVPELSIEMTGLLYAGYELRFELFVRLMVEAAELNNLVKLEHNVFGFSVTGTSELFEAHGVELDVFIAHSAPEALGLTG